MSNNTIKMRDYVLSLSEDAGVTWKTTAGIKTKELTRENPIADSTEQSNTSGETSAAYTGYSTVTISGDGTASTIAGTASLLAWKALVALANSTDPSALMKFENTAAGIYQGNFLITSFKINGEQNGLVAFSIALQNCDAITFTPGV